MPDTTDTLPFDETKTPTQEPAIYETVTEFEASTESARGEGAYWRVRGQDGDFLFKEAPETADDHHRITNGGVKAYALPLRGSDLMPAQFGAPRNGVDDDGEAIWACTTYAQRNGYAVDLGKNVYQIHARSKPLFSYDRGVDDPKQNNFNMFGRGPSGTRLEIRGDCEDFLFKVQGNTSGYSAPHARASEFTFRDFSINGHGHNVDAFQFRCADQSVLDNIKVFDIYGYGLYGRQFWDSTVNARFLRCGDNLRIPYVDQTEPFGAGQKIVGEDSKTTAWLMHGADKQKGFLHITHVDGAFIDGESIVGADGGQATANIPEGIVGSEKAVVDFDYEFGERLWDSACNQIKFPNTSKIEGYRWRAIHLGRGSRQNNFSAKIHLFLGRHYGGPAVYIDGGISNHFTDHMIAHTKGERTVVIDGSNYIAAGNRFIGVSAGAGIHLKSHCRRNSITCCHFDNGKQSCVLVAGGQDNMIRNNIPSGSGPEVEVTASSHDFALLDRVIPERVHIGETIPAHGWSPARLNVYSNQNLTVRFESERKKGAIEVLGNAVTSG